MSFGRCPLTGLTFAEKFPPRVFEVMPGVTPAEQHRRALTIEAACAGTRWKPRAKRYVMFVLNPKPDGNNPGGEGRCLGSFYTLPIDVKKCVFPDRHYPGCFRLFVVDPDAKGEVEFIGNEMQDFWRAVFADRQNAEWWSKAFKQHGLMTRENLPPPRQCRWTVSFQYQQQPPPPQILGEFAVGAKVVCVGLPEMQARLFQRLRDDNTLVDEVCTVRLVNLESGRLLVAQDNGTMIWVEPSGLRAAEESTDNERPAKRAKK